MQEPHDFAVLKAKVIVEIDGQARYARDHASSIVTLDRAFTPQIFILLVESLAEVAGLHLEVRAQPNLGSEGRNGKWLYFQDVELPDDGSKQQRAPPTCR